MSIPSELLALKKDLEVVGYFNENVVSVFGGEFWELRKKEQGIK